ncbi:MAG: 23S rRNA (adenine(2503)-C(2))-methyltransferase RlmN [Desulfovibrionaceae bacterium]|nr:23S rRNA (adenine(2503)-C(2))-methyltransferase RlmN [Desulfovibrionaceae bacterium]
MINILNLDYHELNRLICTELRQPSFRTMQVWKWLWQRGVRSFEQMSNISKELRAELSARAAIIWPEVERRQESSDGTVKFLLRLNDGALIETVLIPGSKGRMTQCLSCQVGCAMGCTFCSTGHMGFTRNMNMAEILGQILVARAYLGDTPENPILRNLVFMGMGEPLLNLQEVMKSLKALNHENGLSFSPRRITVSTCGIRRGLEELGESGLAFLAVSLHATTQEQRARIMPKAANWEFDDLLETLQEYPLKTRERLTFEYLLLGGVNDSLDDARRLVKIMSKVRGKLNLIVYNPAAGLPYQAPSPERVLAFEQYLWSKNVTAILRQSKGQDIMAACGQLKTAHLEGDREKNRSP